MVSKYGGEKLDDFPQSEKDSDPNDEFYIQACLNQDNANFTEVKVLATNHSAWPARYTEDISYRYYFDLSELEGTDYTVDDITITKGYDEWSNTEVSDPIQYKDTSIYYVEVQYGEGSVIAPIGKEQESAELQFRIAMPDASNVWDASNDYSYQGLTTDTQNLTVTPYITMYYDGVLVWGTEPDGTTPEDTTVTTTITKDPTDPTDVTTNTIYDNYAVVDYTGEITKIYDNEEGFDLTTDDGETIYVSNDYSSAFTQKLDLSEYSVGDKVDISGLDIGSGAVVVALTSIKLSDGEVTTTPSSSDTITETTTNTSGDSTSSTLLGDINQDGEVNAIDLLLAKKYVLNILTLEGQPYTNADVTVDGEVDASDLLMMKKYILSIITSFDEV
jgi:hypothetical protein